MDWQLPDIGKTTTNTILPSSLISAYAVRIRRYSRSVDRRWPVISVHFRIVSRYFHEKVLNRTKKETTMQNYNYMYPEKHYHQTRA